MVQFLGPETDIILQFLAPEKVKMGQQNFWSQNWQYGSVSGATNRVLWASGTISNDCSPDKLTLAYMNLVVMEAIKNCPDKGRTNLPNELGGKATGQKKEETEE